MKVSQSCPVLCNPTDYSLPGSSVHGILQAWILEWVAISFSRGSFPSRDWTQVSCIAGRFSTVWAPRGAAGQKWDKLKWSEVAQSCPTLCDPMDCSPPGFSVHGIFQAWILHEYWSGLHSLLQGIFPTQGSNPGLLHCRQTLYGLSYW